MIEELRVSLFAQQLGTKYQVSDKWIFEFDYKFVARGFYGTQLIPLGYRFFI